MEKINIITYATHSDGLFDKLINNKYNIEITVLGWGTKWKNYKDNKAKGIYNYIIKQPKNGITVYLDGFDTLINKNIDNLINDFKKQNCKILLSKDNTELIKTFVKIREWVYKKNFEEFENIKLNAGMFMGYNKNLVNFLKCVVNDKDKDDQKSFNKCINHYNIKIDINETIFKNTKKIYYDNNNIKSYFISFPGGAYNNNYKFKRLLRMPGEYGKNFFNELLIYILIITSLSLLFFKKKYNYSYFKSIIYGLIISLISLLMILLIIILMILLIHI
jgi:hypothetical protein